MCPVFFSINLLDFNYNLLVLDDHELYKITVNCDDGLPKIVLWKATIISFYHSQDLRLYSICWKGSRKYSSIKRGTKLFSIHSFLSSFIFQYTEMIERVQQFHLLRDFVDTKFTLTWIQKWGRKIPVQRVKFMLGSFVWNQIFVVLILNFRNSDPNFTKFIGFWHWQSSRVKVISKVIWTERSSDELLFCHFYFSLLLSLFKIQKNSKK